MKLKEFWKRYFEHPYGVAGFVIFAVLLFMAIFAPLISMGKPNEMSGDILSPPSLKYPFGTDHLGRSVYSRIVYGTRVSLSVGFVAAGLSALIGIFIGAFSGYFGGMVDEVMSKIIDSFLMIPVFFLILIIVAIFGSNLFYIMLVIGLTTWPRNARIMRAQTLSLKERAFVKVAKSLGEGDLRILMTHIIPNGMYPVVANSALQMGGAILAEAALSFLGLGDPNITSWGKMINEARTYMAFAWWTIVFPGIFIILAVVAFSFIADGLQYALYPKLKEVEESG
ncbi:MAG: ABC transporter permease [Thermotoga sp.]|nr:MAG: ABC transporter permease [Thermotoga sp.]